MKIPENVRKAVRRVLVVALIGSSCLLAARLVFAVAGLVNWPWLLAQWWIPLGGALAFVLSLKYLECGRL